MKSYLFILMFVISFIATITTEAQTAENIESTEQSIKDNGKYAMLVMKAQHLKAAILTGKDFRSRSSEIDFQIITCGALVKEISEDNALQKLITEAVKNEKLKILVCGLSIQQFEVDPSSFPAEIPIADNGLIYMFGLQEQGYKSINL